MKEILISIRPEWVEKILGGEKTIEIRKTKPKCELPCKVYIYCTKGKYEQYTPPLSDTNYEHAFGYVMNGKVVAEFILNKVDYHNTSELIIDLDEERALKGSCVKPREIKKYLNFGFNEKPRDFFNWHIDNLKIYNDPKELSEFYTYDKAYNNMFGWAFTEEEKRKYLKRPPQSWCYVEKGEEKC